MSKVNTAILIIIGTILLLGCNSGTKQPDIEVTINGKNQVGYPVHNEGNIDHSYPVGLTGDENIKFGPEFKINEPVRGDDLVVSGTGPSGVPIKLVNVSEVGTVLGETVIDEYGEFRFDLGQPVVSGHSIGIQLGDITGTGLNESDFIYSDTYYERPLIGILFDMVSVK
jgi:hypothetical protein